MGTLRIQGNKEMMIKIPKITLIATSLFLTSIAYGSENITYYNGKNLSAITQSLGTADKVAERGNGQKIYLWQEISSGYDYAGNTSNNLVKSTQSVCVLQVLVSEKNIVLDGVMEGDVLPCAKLKKKIGLIQK